jgi:hypothetical protein
VESICQHGNSPDHVMASYGKNCVLVDTRYTKSFLAHRPIPETHTNIKFLSGILILYMIFHYYYYYY